MPVPRPLPLSAALATVFAAAIALPAHGQSLIELYEAWGKPDRAAPYRALPQAQAKR